MNCKKTIQYIIITILFFLPIFISSNSQTRELVSPLTISKSYATVSNLNQQQLDQTASVLSSIQSIINKLKIEIQSLFSREVKAAVETIGLVRQNCTGYSNCFTSLSAWEAAYGGITFGACAAGDLVCADKIAIAQIDGAWTSADTTAVTIDGWTTDTTHYIRIYTTTAARHSGKWDAGKYRLESVVDGSIIQISQNDLVIEGLQIANSSNSVSANGIFSNVDVGRIKILSNIVRKTATTGTSYGFAIAFATASTIGDIIVANNIVFSDARAWGHGIYTRGSLATSRGIQYNNTVYGADSGFRSRNNFNYAFNNLSIGSLTNAYIETNPYADAQYNGYDLGLDPGINGVDLSTYSDNAIFIDTVNKDFHLIAGSPAKDVGINLSNDAKYSFSDDIDGNTRPVGSAWDIGADEESTIAPPEDTSPPILSSGSPAGALPSGTTQTTLSVEATDASSPVSCKYSQTPGTAYASMTGTLSTTNGTTFTATITGLTNGTSYNYYIRCSDASGNANTIDYTISFSVSAPGGDTTPPTVSITSPTNGATVSGTITITANATDNAGITGVQFKLDNSNLGTEDTTSPYSYSLNTTTITDGSHTLITVARDTSNNYATSTAITIIINNASPPPPDTTAPSIPTGLAATPISSTQINLSWTASTDDVGVAGYRVERCQGTGCVNFTQIAMPTGTSYSDTGLTANTTYRYQVRAVDAAGNLSNYSTIVSATTQSDCNDYPNALFCEDFEQGTFPFDFSGEIRPGDMNNEGSLVDNCGSGRGRCWREIFKPGITDTYFGFAKSVTWPHSNTIYFRYYLRFGDEAHTYSWSTADRSHELKFPDFGYDSADSRIIIKQRAASATEGRFRLYTPDGQNHDLATPILSGQWSCIEFMVQDNGNSDVVKIWANRNNELTPDYSYTSTSNIFGSRWEERWYEFGYRNHAVASDQYFYFDDVVISTQYTGCAPTTLDTTSPLTPTGLTATPISSSQINLSWTASTDNIGVAGYKIYRCAGSGCAPTTQIATSNTNSYSNTGLTASTAYTYAVSAYDSANNESSKSSSVSAATQSLAPQCSDGIDNDSDGKIDFGGLNPDPDCSSSSDTNESDTTPPTISSVISTTLASTTARINWTTNEPATSQVEYGFTTQYGASTTIDSTLLTSHSVLLSNISQDNTTYNYRVRSKDSSGNESISINYSFKTAGLPDTTPPAQTTDLKVQNITQTSADLLTWTAQGDDGSLGTAYEFDIRYTTGDLSASNWNNGSIIKATGEPTPKPASSQMSYTLVGLTANTTYKIALKTLDEAGNQSPISNIITFTTLKAETAPTQAPTPAAPSSGGGGGGGGSSSSSGGGGGGGGGSTSSGGGGGGFSTISDTTPAPKITDLKAHGADKQTRLTWKNPDSSTDWVRTIVVRKEGSFATSTKDGQIVFEGQTQEFTDINLKNNENYYYSLFTIDRTPNYSKPVTVKVKTIALKVSLAEVKSAPLTVRAQDILDMEREAAEIIKSNIISFLNKFGFKRDKTKEDISLKQYVKELIKGLTDLMADRQIALNHFITYGTATTLKLGAGERAGVVNSYKSAFNKLPTTAEEWSDAIKIANGRWPTEISTSTEAKAVQEFKKVYKRAPDRKNPHDDAAVTVISYGLRPSNRNLNSEKAAIKSFRAIYGYDPKSAIDWDIVRAIAYSGAKR